MEEPASKNVFDSLLARGIREGKIPAKSKAAREWFRNQAASTTVARNRLKNETQRQTSNSVVGSMYFFVYDPKTKDDLPYYDGFPLIFIIETYKDGFLGINLHYLPPKARAMLMDALYSLASDKKYDQNTKLTISYQILKSAAKFKLFKPCVKRYLTSQCRSRFIQIMPSEWDIALFLPVANFRKGTVDRVYQDSMDKVYH